jgi:hypothetical protein
MIYSSCARQRARSSTFIASESLFPIRSHGEYYLKVPLRVLVESTSRVSHIHYPRVYVAVLPTWVLVSRMQLAQRYRGFGYFLSAASSSRLKTMVGGALVKASAFRFGLGVSGATIVSGSCARPLQSWMSCLLTSSLSLGISRLFCRATQCM